ncbi:uncharacterized protein LOC134223586 isoform X2 [Armigeres subalbatus]|uniref:uncharacterized protein LOC134223586 isoform X2 n=1 Tax=Armigeres subalbatus TaxID=124917 RepID=UPI002ED4626E
MSEKPAQKLSESDDFTDNSVDNANDAAREDTSQQSGLATVESEYDTASDSPSDGEEYDDQEEEDSESGEEDELVTDGDEDEDADDGSDDDVIEVLDNERQSGDGQEQETDSKRKVDDDEDRSNPQYIPKKGTFYEHDDRTLEDEEDSKAGDESLNSEDPAGPGSERKGDKNAVSKATKKWQVSADRWTHDRFDESEQAPKSRAELVSAYGYDIRSEDGPPRARRRRRYARGPNRYTRNWEDEDAYSKSNVVDHIRQRKVPRPEEFPELGTNNGKTRQNTRRSSKQSRSSGGGDRGDDLIGRQRTERRTSERSRGSNGNRSMGDRDRDRGAERDRNDRYEQPRSERDRIDRDRERNWDRERDYDQHAPDNYRDSRTDGGRYSSERMVNNNSYHNKENKINNRGNKEKDRRGSDYKVITSLQFKNQTRNKTMDGGGMPITGGSGAVNQVVHSNSAGALSGSSNSNKMNNAMDRVQAVPERMLDQRAVQHHYPNQPPQMIQQSQQHQPQQVITHQQQQLPPQQSQVQQAQPQAQPPSIQHHQQSPYVNDDHYDSYSDSKMPKDAKFPYNPPANATIQSVEIGQTDIAKYPTPAGQRPSKDRQPVLAAATGVAMNTRSQISPRQIVSTQSGLTAITATQQLTHQQQQQIQQQSQQQQYQLQQQAQFQQLHSLTTQAGPPTATQAPQTQVPPPQLQQQAPSPLTQPSAAQMHNVHLGASVGQQQLIANDNNSRSSKRYSSNRQRTAMDNPNVVVVQSPLHEQQQQQLLQQQQQQQLLLQQELQHQQQQKLTAQAPKQNYQMNQPSLPLNLQTDYLVQNTTQPAAVSKPQTTAPTQYPAAPYAGYQNFNTVVPQPVTPAVPLTPAQPAAAAVYPSGITYYAPQSQTQTPRPLPSQRRPTSAIPILAPPERKSKNNRIGADSTTGANANINEGEESSVSAAGGSGTTSNTTGAASDIDHILDNMFVQRPVFQPPIRKSPSPAPTATGGASAGGSAVSSMSGSVSDVTSEALKAAELDSLDKIGESVKKLTIQEEKLPLVDASGPEKLEIVPTVAAVDPTTG